MYGEQVEMKTFEEMDARSSRIEGGGGVCMLSSSTCQL